MAHQGERVDPQANRSAALRILLVDDHEAVRAGLRSLLDAERDMEVIAECTDGESAMREAARCAPDVIVMDISMAGVNGLEATTHIARAHPASRIIALTRHDDDAFVKLFLRAGAAGYVLKQSRTRELINAIRTVAQGGTYLDPAIAGSALSRSRRPAGAVASQPRPDLSPREEEVLRLVAWGYSNKEVATRLDLSVKTVETHKTNASYKLKLSGRTDIVRYALLQGWLRDH